MKKTQMILVNGYHAGTPVPEQCKFLGLNHRFAVVLDAHANDDNDWEELKIFLEVLKLLIKTDNSLSLFFLHENGMVFNSLNGFEEHLNKCVPDDMPFYFKIEIKKDDITICLIVPELWNSIGGSAPYHDSYTFSFFTIQNMSNEFIKISEKVCKKLQFDIVKIIDGEPLPIPIINIKIGLFNRIWNWIKK